MAKILIVEDNNNQRLLLEEELQYESYAVLSAASGEQALALVATTMPDLVVLDIRMPGMDGIELLGRLLGINKRLPVVIYTAYDTYRHSFMSWAADAYVVKQSDLSTLKNTIGRLLEKRRSPPAHRGALRLHVKTS